MSATIPNLAGFDMTLPANIDAEKSILGAILLDNGAIYEAQEHGLTTDDFSLDAHQRIYLHMADMMAAQMPVDIVTLANSLSLHKEVQAVGGAPYLCSLTEGLPRRPVVRDYVRIVREKAMARRVMSVSAAAIARAADQSESAMDVLGGALTALEGVASSMPNFAQDVAQILVDDGPAFETEADAPAQGTLGAVLFTPELSRITCGIQANELCMLCARPGQGKTEAAIQAVVENGRLGYRVHMQSLEMKRWQIVRRMVRYIARVPITKMRDPRTLTPDERNRIRMARLELAELPIAIDDTHELTITDYRSRAILAAKRWKADLLVVDYAQLLLVPRAKSPLEEPKKQAETLRHIARDYCRTLALAQLRRCPPNDLNRFPDIEDILGSSAFEQAAQMILLLHRTRENKRYTGEDFCFIGKMRELQSIEPLGIKAEKWGAFVDRYDEPTSTQETWHDRI